MESSAIWLVVILALLGANVPFMSERLLLLVPLRTGKSWLVRLGELVALYLVVGGVALGLEARLGQVYPQHWEFYAVSLSMFLVLAFPGYVLRYLVRRPAA